MPSETPMADNRIRAEMASPATYKQYLLGSVSGLVMNVNRGNSSLAGGAPTCQLRREDELKILRAAYQLEQLIVSAVIQAAPESGAVRMRHLKLIS